jgi:cell division protein FtsQ
MMLPKARTRRRLAWPFSRRGNRRVRLTQSRFSGLGARLKGSLRGLIVVGVLAALGAGGWGLHRFLTRSAHFAVRELRFSTTKHVAAESLAARAGEVVGQNLFRVDLDQIARDVMQEPWVQSAHARRELPSTLMVDIVEREAAVGVALGPVYLADARGIVFKRANPDEAVGLAVVTGIDRDLYLADPDGAQAEVREALQVLQAWQKRPAVGEAHLDKLLGVTLYLAEGNLGVRVGRPDGDLTARLKRYDAVAAALASSGEKPRLIFLDNRARPDRVTVKLAPAPAPPKPKKASKTEVGDDPVERDT